MTDAPPMPNGLTETQKRDAFGVALQAIEDFYNSVVAELNAEIVQLRKDNDRLAKMWKEARGAR